jgi:hypothetical protein
VVQGQVYSVLNQTNTSVAGLTLFGVLFGQLNALVRLLMAYMLSGRYALALALAYAGESGFSLVDTLANHRYRLSGYGLSGSIAVSTQFGRYATPTKTTTGYYDAVNSVGIQSFTWDTRVVDQQTSRYVNQSSRYSDWLLVIIPSMATRNAKYQSQAKRNKIYTSRK